MKWKFDDEMEVTSDNLPEYHRLKGFEKGQIFTCYSIEKGSEPSSKWGIWIISDTKNAIRLQDLGGMVTGHGNYFRPVTKEERKKLMGGDGREDLLEYDTSLE